MQPSAIRKSVSVGDGVGPKKIRKALAKDIISDL